MSTITFDGQSFIVDNRRIWLVSGTIAYARVPHQLWRSRIRAAREAGLNCIETPIFWNTHEPSPGRFNFEGDLNLRQFVRMVGEEGLYCVLRPGPCVDEGWDGGGLPAWLSDAPDIRLREASPPFLEAVARYFGAVMGQVRDLQITTPVEGLAPATPEGNAPGRVAGGFTGGGAGPVLLMQAEHLWLCHNPEQADRYLRELVRYLRENGCAVPILMANNLWHRVEGTVDTWIAAEHLTADLRQLAVVQPEAPRLVSAYPMGEADHWGERRDTEPAPEHHLLALAQILAAGGQYNLAPFHGGTNFGFSAGRDGHAAGRYLTTSHSDGAPLLEAGGRTGNYHAIRRISTFASQFGSVFAHLDAQSPHVAVGIDGVGGPLSIVHLTGSLGEVVFIFKAAKDPTDQVDLMLSNGLTLPVPLGRQRVAWLLLKTNLGGAAHLQYTNLSPWAFIDRRMLVLFGPPGVEGIVGLEDAQLQIKVPTGREPAIEQIHDELTVVVLSTDQLQDAYLYKAGLAMHCAGLDTDGEPLPTAGRGDMLLIATDGTLEARKGGAPRRPIAPRIDAWRYAPLDDFIDGSSDQYQKTTGPRTLQQCGVAQGYAWYRIGVGAARSGKVLAPGAGDRLHLYSSHKLQAVLGEGPGASTEPVDAKLGGDLVVLADNLGRADAGTHLGESKGLFDHLYHVRAAKLPKPTVHAAPAPDPFITWGYVPGQRRAERTAGETVTWIIKPQGRKAMILDVRGLPVAGVFSLNDHPLAYYHPNAAAGHVRLIFDPAEDHVSGGQNELKLALFAPTQERVRFESFMKLYQVTQSLTQRGQWAFARWSQPEDDAFATLPRELKAQPTWFRSTFTVRDRRMPLWLEPRGMSKGQIYLNGRNVGRYFVATAEGKPVPPQKQYYLPEPWLKEGEPNDLVLFDEHGKSPAKCRLAYGITGPTGK